MTIKSKDPVREAFRHERCQCYDRQYYYTKGHAVNAFDTVLQKYGYRFDYADTQTLYGNEGRKLCDIIPHIEGDYGSVDPVGKALLAWYRMPSGRWEFVAYIV